MAEYSRWRARDLKITNHNNHDRMLSGLLELLEGKE